MANMANAAYMHVARGMDLTDLLRAVEDVRSLEHHRGWQLVAASVDLHRERLLAQLLNPSAKAEDVDRLRGEILGLNSVREAVESILHVAAERERQANAELEHQHV